MDQTATSIQHSSAPSSTRDGLPDPVSCRFALARTPWPLSTPGASTETASQGIWEAVFTTCTALALRPALRSRRALLYAPILANAESRTASALRTMTGGPSL
jgi:hypothetical protein